MVWSDVIDDLGDLRFKTKIEHSVSLVDDNHSDPSQVCDLAVIEC